jgi:P4 family phage/plasmid primase-like protien
MNRTIENILRNHYVDDNSLFQTHVSLIKPLGKFQFNRSDLEEFWETYCKLIDEDENAVVGIAEKPYPYLPVLVDADIKIEETDDIIIEENVYNESHVLKVVETYQSVLRNIVEDCTDQNLTCVLLEKPMYRKFKNEKSYVSRGFHLMFPNLFLLKTDQEQQLVPRVQDLLKRAEVFLDLGFQDSGSVIDKASCTVPWLLYGSRKSPDMDAYKVTKVYDSSCEEISLEDAFRHYKVFDNREKAINIRGQVQFYLPRILSIIPYGRETKELRHGLLSPLKEKIRTREIKTNSKVSVSDALKESAKLLPLLDIKRCEDYYDWMTVGWCLFNIGEGCEDALDQWLSFSSRCEEKYDEGKCISEWEHMVVKDFTLGTLKHFAKHDNPSGYDEYKKAISEQYINSSLGGSHTDIANILYAEYGQDFVCASISSKIWYQFIGHKWEQIEEGVFLREKISKEIVEKYSEMIKNLSNRYSANADKAEGNADANKIKQTVKIMQNLRSCQFKSSVMREALDIFYDKRFKEKLNVNPYLFAFKNGVYDLKLNVFRAGRPEDFISKCAPFDYQEYKVDDPEMLDVLDYLEKVFPDKSLRTYFLDQTSDVFVGGNSQKTGIFWSGEGDNAKSVTQTIIEKMLGPYAIKLPTTVLTGKKPSSGSAFADLARTGDGVRWVVAEEPDKDEMINTGTFKHLTGNDSYYARDLFEKGKDVKEITPLYKLCVICNSLPRMKYADKATFNRVKVLTFESTFCRSGYPESYEEQLRQKKFPMDPNFSKKIPSLIPAFAYLLLEHRKKLVVRVEPEKVLIATAMYRKQNDVYREFIEENIMEAASNKLSLTELYAQFKEWYKDSFPGQAVPVKNDVREYFSKLWGEPSLGLKWTGHRIRTLDDDLEDGTAVILGEDDLVDYSEEGIKTS